MNQAFILFCTCPPPANEPTTGTTPHNTIVCPPCKSSSHIPCISTTTSIGSSCTPNTSSYRTSHSDLSPNTPLSWTASCTSISTCTPASGFARTRFSPSLGMPYQVVVLSVIIFFITIYQPLVGKYRGLPWTRTFSFPDIVQTLGRNKVYSLANIETVWKTSMVCLSKGHFTLKKVQMYWPGLWFAL